MEPKYSLSGEDAVRERGREEERGGEGERGETGPRRRLDGEN